MKTALPQQITNTYEAKAFLKALRDNSEDYHPEDNAHDIEWSGPPSQRPTAPECEQLNKLMKDIYSLKGFDACEYLTAISEAPNYDRIINAYQNTTNRKQAIKALKVAFNELGSPAQVAFPYYLREVSKAPTLLRKDMYHNVLTFPKQ